MPIYSYQCKSCGDRMEKYVRLRDYKEIQICHTCSHEMDKMIDICQISQDYEPYTCPITGVLISGKKEHRENLRRHGKRVFESGEKEEFMRKKQLEESNFEKRVDETIDREISKLSSDQKARLAHEVVANNVLISRE